MPKTLYLHILTEVARIVAVASVVLVMVMAFATAIKPLSEGMLGADTLLKFVVYMSPSMLQYALPFAATMGATLVYIRMSQDNEVLACQASGLDHKWLVAPVAFFGAGIMVLLLVLSSGIGPAFYRRAERTASGDILGTMVRKLDQRQPFIQETDGGAISVFANSARVADVPPSLPGDLQPDYLVSMRGVAVGQWDAKGRMDKNITARGAAAFLYHDENSNNAWVKVRLEDPQLMDLSQGADHQVSMGSAKAIDDIKISLPNLVRDKVEFLSITELLGLLSHPEKFDGIRQCTDKLAEVAAAERFRRSVVAGLSAGVPLLGPLGGETYTVSAPASASEDGGDLSLASASERKVTVEHRVGSALLRRWEAQEGRMRFKLDGKTNEPVAILTLKRVRVSDPRNLHVASAQAEYVFDALAWPPTPLEDIHLTADEWLEKTQVAAGRIPALADARNQLISEKSTLRHKVIAQMNLRASSALMCLLLSVLGASMSLWRRHSLPLVVFFWCFLIAVVSIILTNTGYSIARGEGARFGGGLALIWLPAAVQAGLNAWILRHLARPGR